MELETITLGYRELVARVNVVEAEWRKAFKLDAHNPVVPPPSPAAEWEVTFLADPERRLIKVLRGIQKRPYAEQLGLRVMRNEGDFDATAHLAGYYAAVARCIKGVAGEGLPDNLDSARQWQRVLEAETQTAYWLEDLVATVLWYYNANLMLTAKKVTSPPPSNGGTTGENSD